MKFSFLALIRCCKCLPGFSVCKCDTWLQNLESESLLFSVFGIILRVCVELFYLLALRENKK